MLDASQFSSPVANLAARLNTELTLLTRMSVSLALDVLNIHPCPRCRVMRDNSADHVLCCHKHGFCACHNESWNERADVFWGVFQAKEFSKMSRFFWGGAFSKVCEGVFSQKLADGRFKCRLGPWTNAGSATDMKSCKSCWCGARFLSAGVLQPISSTSVNGVKQEILWHISTQLGLFFAVISSDFLFHFVFYFLQHNK